MTVGLWCGLLLTRPLYRWTGVHIHQAVDGAGGGGAAAEEADEDEVELKMVTRPVEFTYEISDYTRGIIASTAYASHRTAPNRTAPHCTEM